MNNYNLVIYEFEELYKILAEIKKDINLNFELVNIQRLPDFKFKPNSLIFTQKEITGLKLTSEGIEDNVKALTNLKLTENLKLFQKDNEYVLDPSKDFYHNNIPKIVSILEAIAIEVSNLGLLNKITDLHKKLYLHK